MRNEYCLKYLQLQEIIWTFIRISKTKVSCQKHIMFSKIFKNDASCYVPVI